MSSLFRLIVSREIRFISGIHVGYKLVVTLYLSNQYMDFKIDDSINKCTLI